jgi:hypothetical protein
MSDLHNTQEVSDDLIIEDLATPQTTQINGPIFEPWYSPNTIETVVKELEAQDDGKMNYAFLTSSPSFYFALKNRERSKLFDVSFLKINSFHRMTQKDGKMKQVLYTSILETLPLLKKNMLESLKPFSSKRISRYGFVIVDPTSINREFWELYTISIKKLLAEGGKILACTVSENQQFMKELLNLTQVQYVPSIPNLV